MFCFGHSSATSIFFAVGTVFLVKIPISHFTSRYVTHKLAHFYVCKLYFYDRKSFLCFRRNLISRQLCSAHSLFYCAVILLFSQFLLTINYLLRFCYGRSISFYCMRLIPILTTAVLI